MGGIWGKERARLYQVVWDPPKMVSARVNAAPGAPLRVDTSSVVVSLRLNYP